MAHFAKVLDGVVVQVIVAEQEFIDSLIDTSPGTWLQTSYNTKDGAHTGGSTPLRKNFAVADVPSWPRTTVIESEDRAVTLTISRLLEVSTSVPKKKSLAPSEGNLAPCPLSKVTVVSEVLIPAESVPNALFETFTPITSPQSN